jgi:hypothetical protein
VLSLDAIFHGRYNFHGRDVKVNQPASISGNADHQPGAPQVAAFVIGVLDRTRNASAFLDALAESALLMTTSVVPP